MGMRPGWRELKKAFAFADKEPLGSFALSLAKEARALAEALRVLHADATHKRDDGSGRCRLWCDKCFIEKVLAETEEPNSRT